MKCERLSWDLLVRAVDRELSASEAAWVPAHIAECADCHQECEAIENVSLKVESAVNGVAILEYAGDRERLAATISRRDNVKPVRHAPEKVMWRFGWGMAIAATLAIGIMLAPKQRISTVSGTVPEQTAVAANAIEVDGETFVALPYSNPDLPTNAPRIVQMQVPVASLAGIGISVTPVVNEAFSQDRTVLADVLLGADGQPLGVHVVSWE